MSKAQRIMSLLAAGTPIDKVCEICKCPSSYVRTALRRTRLKVTTGSVSSPQERAYQRKRLRENEALRRRKNALRTISRRKKIQTDPEYRERCRAYKKAYRERRKMTQGSEAHGH